jgi:dienelactone hydrolase
MNEHIVEQLDPCCDPSAPSSIWEGEPTGRVIEIEGIEAYISQPRVTRDIEPGLLLPADNTTCKKSEERVILLLTEGHGIYLPNAQLLADSFASALNCDVLMPDQFAGQARLPMDIASRISSAQSASPTTVPWTEDPTDQNFELRGQKMPLKENPESSDAYPFLKPPWWKDRGLDEFEKWKKRHEYEITDPILEKVVKYIHSKYGKEVSLGGVGYCFGGRYVMRLMGQGVIDVGVVNHPSFFTMEEVGKLGKHKRLACFAAETDDILPSQKRREMEDVLTRNGATWMSTVFSGTEHGFSVRGDLSIKEVRIAKERAFGDAVDWFKDWL